MTPSHGDAAAGRSVYRIADARAAAVSSLIRLARDSDGAAVASIYAPAVATPTSFELIAPDGAEMTRRIQAAFPEYPWLVCETDDNVVGYAYGGAHGVRPAYAWSVNVSIYVASGFHGRGVGRALYTALLELLSAQGRATAFAGISLPNEASVALHVNMGFRLVGVYRRVGFKNGEWHDVAYYQRPLASYSAEPPRLRKVTELDVEELDRAFAAGIDCLQRGRPAAIDHARGEPGRGGCRR